MYIKGRFISYGEPLNEVFAIRKAVFQDEQGMTNDMDQDGKDKEAVHVVAYEIGNENRPVATGRICMLDNEFRIGKIAVLKEERGKYYGDFVVRMLVDKAFLLGAKKVSVSAITTAVHFYEKIGFHKTGEEYMENGTPHVMMYLDQGDLCSKCHEK